uniref:Urease accessory protein UreE n=1 Tax=OCS116 cluster bacterium TaxID=2030921 RepID=A0A2A4ZBD4_9PROT
MSDIAQTIKKKSSTTPIDTVVLDYESRYLRRKLLHCTNGLELLIDLPKATVLEHDDFLILQNGQSVQVKAADEALLEIKASDTHRLTVIAYHLGNRHLPVQVEPTRLLIKQDHVIEDMLKKMQADVKHVSLPFNPEGGAYGLGRTHGHDHGHSHDSHSHDH